MALMNLCDVHFPVNEGQARGWLSSTVKVSPRGQGKPFRVALLVPKLDMGGGARAAMYLASGLAVRGYDVDLIVLGAGGALEPACPSNVRIVRPGPSRVVAAIAWLVPKVFDVHYADVLLEKLPSLIRYLQNEQPAILVSFAGSAIAVLAAKISRVRCRTAISAQVALSPILQLRNRPRAIFQRFVTRLYLGATDIVIAVSRGVADDLQKIRPISEERIRVINNPVVVPGPDDESTDLVGHAWFMPGSEPVILGVGQLKPQKDFATLIRAFARVRAERNAKLLILGEGSERGKLEALVRELALEGCVEMPGYDPNPYKFMKRASAFVLSSEYEGCPLVLAEALAVGTPIIATDCEAGPAEILDYGRFGRLVPVHDAEALASAIVETLDQPPDRDKLRSRGSDFALEKILPRYIQALGLPPTSSFPASGGAMDGR